ncbi:MAG: hypothetical protein ACFBSD_14735 [Paracoccaceae bacterium]
MTAQKTLAGLGLALVLATPAAATDIVIYTGGAPTGEGSTYHNGMGQGVLELLEDFAEPYGYTVRRIPSNGAIANAEACATETDNICFGIGQGGLSYDAVTRGDTQIIRNDLPGECAMAFTKEPRLPNWASVVANAQRVTFVAAEGSGSAAFIERVFATEPELQGITPRFNYVSGLENQLAAVASTRGALGVFYAYPNPIEGTINEAADDDFTIMGILSPAVAKEDPAYYLNRRAPFELSWFGLGSTKTVPAMCSKALLFAGQPERITDEWARGDYEEMIQKLKDAPAEAFIPDGGPLADLMETVEGLSEEYGVSEMVDDLEAQVKEQL